MDAFKPYDIDGAALTAHVASLNGLIAGSFALAGYLKQEGIDPGFEPNDIDIFLPGKLELLRNDDGTIIKPLKFRIRSLNRMAVFLNSYGYTENNKFDKFKTAPIDYYNAITKVRHVVSFNNKNGREIQIIVIKSDDILEHIKKDFDLSCCISYWHPDMGAFVTMSPLTKEKKMYPPAIPPDYAVENAKLEQRIKKYQGRGFILVKGLCPRYTKTDVRETLADTKFDGLTAHDILTMEDVSIRDFLAVSDWNIILKTGEQFYAFERDMLMKLMAKSQTWVDAVLDNIYDTPFHQSITTHAYCSLKFSDHTIYELTPAYSTRVKDKTKSLYTLTAYTVKEWVDGAVGEKMAHVERSILRC